MTAPTHVAIACAIGAWCGLDGEAMAWMGLGALLPDLDHPQSAIGRLALPLSVPLHRWLGHRRAVHGVWWVGVALCGMWWPAVGAVGWGAVTHVLADCACVAGVQALVPWSERVLVLFARRWRLTTGGRGELAVLAIATAAALAGSHVAAIGGVRALVGRVTGAPAIARQHVVAAGIERCEVVGRLRLPDGTILDGAWLALAEGQAGLALLDGDRVWHVPHDAVLLAAHARRTGYHWATVEVRGLARVHPRGAAWWYDGRVWRRADDGALVHGYIAAMVPPVIDAVRLEPPGGWQP